MKAVILAAGDGTRMGNNHEKPKILIELLGRTLLERNLASLAQLGFRDFVLVLGYGAKAVESFIEERRLDERYNITLVHNERWLEGNALSLLAARPFVGSRFLVVMGDHLFDPRNVKGLLGRTEDLVGLFDSAPRYIDINEATKAQAMDGQVVGLGKGVEEFTHVDAGLFLCRENVFPVIERCLHSGKDEWNDVKREWIKDRPFFIHDLRGGFWLDIDTEEDRRRAEELLIQRSSPPHFDGLISRYLNRRLSRPLARALVKTPLTPHQISVASFLLALMASSAFLLGSHILGGLLAQLASVIDGVDGDLARLRGTISPFGAFFDALLDRYADAAIILGMTISAWRFQGGHPVTWLFGLLALIGSLLVSYSAARAEASMGMRFHKLPATLATRDIRLFLIMVGSVLGQTYWTLFLLALLTNLVVLYRVSLARQKGPSI